MLTLAQKRKPTQGAKSEKSERLRRSNSGKNLDVHSILRVQQTGGNQAVQRSQKANADNLEDYSLTNGSPCFSHDLSRIPLRTCAHIQTKMRINTPGDIYEQEAEHIANQLVRVPISGVQHHKEKNGFETRKPATSDLFSNSAGGSHQSLSDALQSYFQPRFGFDFSQVRIHSNANASNMAGALRAKAFTVGRDIIFGKDAYSPHTVAGRQLIAHELTHVVQQGEAERLPGPQHSFLSTGAGYVQRDIAEDQLPNTPVEQIMSDDNYFENGIQRIEFYSAELAILHYDDGSNIRLGLVPEQITAPFEAVDYRTPRSLHITVSSTTPSLGRGEIRFLPRGREAEFPPDITFGDIPRLTQEVGRTIRFTHHPNGRIVPTEVNSLSAPRLSEALREAEAEYVRRFDAMSEGAIEVLKKLEWIIILGSLFSGLAASGPRAAAGRGAAGRAGAAAAAGVVGRAQSTLVRFFTRLLGRGTAEAITVEGVGFGGVRVATRGTELVVSRATIVNASRIPAQGRLIHGAFEQAAIQVARQTGARTARVALELVQNPRWAAFLESRGYTFQVIANEAGGFTRVLTKVFTL